MVSGMKQGQMEKPLLELLHQQQLEMEGQLKELPQEELQEQADDVSEQHMGAEKHSGGQVSEYPQCCLEDLNGDGCRKLAGESLDECTEEQQSWLKLPAIFASICKRGGSLSMCWRGGSLSMCWRGGSLSICRRGGSLSIC